MEPGTIEPTHKAAPEPQGPKFEDLLVGVLDVAYDDRGVDGVILQSYICLLVSRLTVTKKFISLYTDTSPPFNHTHTHTHTLQSSSCEEAFLLSSRWRAVVTADSRRKTKVCIKRGFSESLKTISQVRSLLT